MTQYIEGIKDDLYWYLLAMSEKKDGKLISPQYISCKYISAISRTGRDRCAMCKAYGPVVDGQIYPECTISVFSLVK